MAWLSVPGLEDSNSDSDLPSEKPIELFAMSSGMPSPHPLSWHGWKTRSWIRRLFGTISRPSAASRGVDVWTSSLRASHANQSPPQEGAGVQPMPAGSGPTSPESFARYDPNGCFLKTSAASSTPTEVQPSPKFSGAWPTLGMMRSGACSARPKPPRLIGGKDFSSWPTPKATQAGSLNRSSSGGPPQDLAVTARNWPTPQVDSFRSRGGNRIDEVGLDRMARTWPTPRASPNENRGTKRVPSHGVTHGKILSEEAIEWMKVAPASRDWKDGANPSANAPMNSPLGRQAPRSMMNGPQSSQQGQTSRPLWRTPATTNTGTPTEKLMAEDGSPPKLGERMHRLGKNGEMVNQTQSLEMQTSVIAGVKVRLNPVFVEWLMGWPLGWTDFERVETESFHSWLHSHTELLERVLENEHA